MSTTTNPAGVRLRPGTLSDVPAILGLMDIATAWLAKQGRDGQWGDGSSPHATNPTRIKQITDMIVSGGTWVAVGPVPAPLENAQDPDAGAPSGADQVIGALTVHSTAVPYVSPATEPERYIQLLLTHRAWKGRSLGTLLVDKAREITRATGVSRLRVDCYAGGDGKLVKWYESQGFVKTETFVGHDGAWPGQVLEMSV